MRFLYQFPGFSVPANLALLSAGALSELAALAEECGFHGVGLAEHPAPPESWRRDAAGHDSIDPIVGLAAVAASTHSIRLFTHACVLPYRNPFLLAKATSTLDVLSGGRLCLGVAAGYLEAESAALGVSFARRNELFDEALVVLKLAWTGEPVTYQGSTFTAEENVVSPRPLQRPHPPIWIGGNSRLSLRRVASNADGWLSMPNARTRGISRHSAALESVADLEDHLRVLRGYTTECGRTTPPEVMYGLPSDPRTSGRAELVLELAGLGVTWLRISGRATTLAGAREELLRCADEVAQFS